MNRNAFLKICLPLPLALAAIPGFASATEPEPALIIPPEQFAQIAALVGQWDVEGKPTLKIVFEPTANNSVILERWMVGTRLHSLTVYHLDGAKLMATHYCPQGNQPRMTAGPSISGDIRFSFQDATDLDSSEGFQHDLKFAMQGDDKIVRSEIYWGPTGVGDESVMMLSRASSGSN